jgi:NitT/TauT family transport system substrate-binding protein
MKQRRGQHWSRRQFVRGLTWMGTAGLLRLTSSPAAAEPSPETTRIRLSKVPSVCVAPQYVAEEFLRSEGFTDVRYVATGTPQRGTGLAGGEIDFSMGFVGNWIKQVDAGDPIVMLTGIHVGCYELIASEGIRTIAISKARRLA